jgi:hypothetical protein
MVPVLLLLALENIDHPATDSRRTKKSSWQH